ncbi:MAG: hypothetical protein WD273_02875 [Trueperaceae bacterium]
MLELLFILVGIVVAFLLFFWVASSYTSRVFARIANRHGEDTEWIVQSGIAPPEWSDGQKQRIARMEAMGASPQRLDRAKARYREWLIARLERHLRYLERATVFRNEYERNDLTDRLREVGRSWENSRWEQIVGEEEFGLPG